MCPRYGMKLLNKTDFVFARFFSLNGENILHRKCLKVVHYKSILRILI